ncbi:hypothetical protein [Eubacterium limosum]|uniref:hypothetical protein n=1 Tax=Eubacterium limosum TaxID=1736 RepID=UPI0010632809|nr:hypothetical protein [Eubacterium limosum]
MKAKNKAKLIGAQILLALCYFIFSTAVALMVIGFIGMMIDGICTIALILNVNILWILIAIGGLSFVISMALLFKDRKDIFPS